MNNNLTNLIRLESIPRVRRFRWTVVGSNSAFQHRLSGLFSSCILNALFSSSTNCLCNSMPFHVPTTLSVHIPLDVRYSPVSLNVPVTHHRISYFRFLLYCTDPPLSVHTFLYGKHLDPYIRGFRQFIVEHSHHRYFIDSRRVIYIRYLYRTFVSLTATVDFRRLHRAPDSSHYSRSRSEYQRKRFKALPYHSTPRVASF